jgi:hypothetical protein
MMGAAEPLRTAARILGLHLSEKSPRQWDFDSALADVFTMTAIAMDSMGAHYPDGDKSNGLWTDTGAPMYEWDATLAVALIVVEQGGSTP